MECENHQPPEATPPGSDEAAMANVLPEHGESTSPEPALQPATLGRTGFLVLALVFEGGLGLGAVLLARWFHLPSPFSQIEWNLAGLAWGAGAGTSMALLLMLGLWIRVPWLMEMLRALDEALLPTLRRCGLLDVAFIAALAGIGEELLFRCVVQGGIAAVIGGTAGPWIGLAIAAVAFGFLHPLTRGYIVVAGLFGLVLGLLWMASGNLLAPIVAHGWYDFLALQYLAHGRKPEETGLGQQ